MNVDRLAELQSYSDPKAKVELVGGAKSPVVQSFLSPYEEIKAGVRLIEVNTDKLSKLQERERVSVKESARNEMQAEVKALKAETTSVGRKLSASLQRIRRENSERKTTPTDALIHDNMFHCHSRNLQQAWERYLQVCQSGQQDFYNRAHRQCRCVDNTLTDQQIDTILFSGQADQVLKAAMISENLKSVVRDIDTRHKEVLKLERDVLELHELFKDLSTLTMLQQERIDSIEGHIEKARKHTERAEDNLNKAEKHQQSARKKQCGLLAGGLVALAIVVAPLSAAKAF